MTDEEIFAKAEEERKRENRAIAIYIYDHLFTSVAWRDGEWGNWSWSTAAAGDTYIAVKVDTFQLVTEHNEARVSRLRVDKTIDCIAELLLWEKERNRIRRSISTLVVKRFDKLSKERQDELVKESSFAGIAEEIAAMEWKDVDWWCDVLNKESN